MIKILFVCHGNICRSPMAEGIMKDLAQKAGAAGRYTIASAATSHEEDGNPVYPPARRKLAEHGIELPGKRATPLTAADYGRYDLLIGMERRHVAAMERLFGGDPAGKLRRLLDYTDQPRDIADPWYTGDFETAYREILRGCRALFAALEAGHDL